MSKTNIRGTQIADGSNGVDLTVDVFNTLPVANGGTNASTASAARTSLGLVIGTDVAAIASPTFTGTPAAPTAAVGTSTTQVATTAFVAQRMGPETSPLIAGQFHRPPAGATTLARLLVANELSGAVVDVGRATNITSLAITVTVAGSAGSVIRLGVYSYNRLTRACALVADFGTVTTTSTGTFTATGTAAVVAGGTYAMAAVSQGSPTTPPTVTSCASIDTTMTNGAGAAGIIASAALTGIKEYGSSPSGALPSTFTTPSGSDVNVPLVAFMASS